MFKQKKYEFNQQFATLRLREPINEGRVMFTIDDEDIDQVFSNQFEADVDYIHDGPDVYYVTNQNDLEKFVDYVESLGLDSDKIQIQQYMKEEGNVTGGEAYAAAMDVPSKKQNPFKEDALSGYTQDKNFRPGHTADKGGFQYKDLWGLNEAKVIGKTKSGKDIYLDFNNPAHKDFTAADHDDASSALLTVKSQPGMRSKNTVTPERKKAAKQHFDASKTKQKGLSEAKQEWAVNNIEALINNYATQKGMILKPIDKKQQTNQYGSKKTIYIYKLGDKDLIMIDDKAAGAPRLNDFIVAIGNIEPGTTVLKNSTSVNKFGSWGTEDIIKMLDKVFTIDDKNSVLREMQETIDEIFTKQDYDRVMQVVQKIKYTNTALYNAIMDLVDDIYPHDYKEVEKLVGVNENYNRFKNETKTRTNPEQFHQAVKSVKRKVEEIHKLYEYMERLQKELSEGNDGLKYRKYTENAMQKIKEAVKTLHIKTKKLK